jgi:hypothetical protein
MINDLGDFTPRRSGSMISADKTSSKPPALRQYAISSEITVIKQFNKSRRGWSLVLVCWKGRAVVVGYLVGQESEVWKRLVRL